MSTGKEKMSRASNGINVLYIDDEKSNLEVFKALVRRDGYNVHTTTSTKEAFKILKANEIHIVLSDQRMVGITGIEFFESIIKDYPKPIRILTTAYSDFHTVIDAINKGRVYECLCKPWEYGGIRAALIQSYDFPQFKPLIDVGGGQGIAIASLLGNNPQMRGCLYEQSSVIEGAKTVLETQGVINRCDLISGDFLESIPKGYDAYLLKHVLNDWENEKALTILRNCRASIAKHGKLLIIGAAEPVTEMRHGPFRN